MSTSVLPTQIHCVGIGGIGMSGVAMLLAAQGHRVSGSDAVWSARLHALRALGIRVHVGHAAGQLDGATLVVHSSCIPPDNPELQHARAHGIPIMSRADVLHGAMKRQSVIVVSGSHGKTTTTGLIAQMFVAAGWDPSFFVGAEVASLAGYAHVGTGQHSIVEADESDGSLVSFSPHTAVVTNLDREHMDHYGDMDTLRRTFTQFMRQVDADGTIWVCADDAALVSLARHAGAPVRTFGMQMPADVMAGDIQRCHGAYQFIVTIDGAPMGTCLLPLPGEHNISNALAAIGVGYAHQIPLGAIQTALRTFSGAYRRFRAATWANGVTVIDDYAHHPTEIRATLAAIERQAGQRLMVVFQPHRYSRTQDQAAEYLTCFDGVDRLVVTDIYAAFEAPIPGVTSERLVRTMHGQGMAHAHYVPRAHVLEALQHEVAPGDMVVLLGAGDIGELYAATEQLLAYSAA